MQSWDRPVNLRRRQHYPADDPTIDSIEQLHWDIGWMVASLVVLPYSECAFRPRHLRDVVPLSFSLCYIFHIIYREDTRKGEGDLLRKKY